MIWLGIKLSLREISSLGNLQFSVPFSCYVLKMNLMSLTDTVIASVEDTSFVIMMKGCMSDNASFCFALFCLKDHFLIN